MPTGAYLAAAILQIVDLTGRIRLYTVTPTDEEPGEEVTGGSYVAALPTWVANPADDKQLWNDAAVSYTDMPACTVTGIAITDNGPLNDGVGYNTYYYDNLSVPIVVDEDDTLTWDANTIILDVE